MGRVRELRRDYPTEWVCLTGGEPLLQDIEDVLSALKAADLQVQVETNGTRPPRFPVDWYTASPKPPDYALDPGLVEEARELKLVVSEELTEEACLRLSSLIPDETPLILQPESNRERSIARGLDLLREILRSGRSRVRLSLQLHKFLGIP